MTVVRDFADNFLEKVKYIVAMYTMLSADRMQNLQIKMWSSLEYVANPKLTRSTFFF